MAREPTDQMELERVPLARLVERVLAKELLDRPGDLALLLAERRLH